MEPEPASKKPHKRRHYPWAQVRTIYVQGEDDGKGSLSFPTLQDVAGRFEIDCKYVRRRAAKGEWTKARETYKAEYQKKCDDIRLKERLKKVKDFEQDCSKVSDTGLTHIKQHFNAHIRKQKDPTNFEPMSLKDLEMLSRAAERFQKIGCVSLGLPDSNTLIGSGERPLAFKWLHKNENPGAAPGSNGNGEAGKD